MKRRTFIQSFAAALSLPMGATLPLRSATAVLPTAAAAVPTKARFWAIYMSSLHGECTPQTLHNLLHIPKVDANRYVSQLIADGVIKPNPLLQKSVSQVLKAKDENLIDKFKKRSDMKAQAGSEKLEIQEASKAIELEDDEAESKDELLEIEGFQYDDEESELVEADTEEAKS